MSNVEWILSILKYFSFVKGLYWAFSRNVRMLGICANIMVLFSRDLWNKQSHFINWYIYGNIVFIITSAASHRVLQLNRQASDKWGKSRVSDNFRHWDALPRTHTASTYTLRGYADWNEFFIGGLIVLIGDLAGMLWWIACSTFAVIQPHRIRSRAYHAYALNRIEKLTTRWWRRSLP